MSAVFERPRIRSRAEATEARLTRTRWAEVAFVTSLAAVVLVLTGLPYAYAYLSAPSGQQFMGILLNVPDTAQYLSWARESVHSVLIENKLTSEHGPAVYFNLFWLLVGRLANVLGLGLAETAQVVRPAAGAIYILGIYWFAGLVFPDRLRRWTSTLVAVVGGGFGWILVVQKMLTHSREVAFPLDLYVTEPNTFLSIMAFPLQAIAGGLLVITLGLAALAFERRSLRPALLGGAIGLLLCLLHGYDLVVVYAVVGAVALLYAAVGPHRLKPIFIAAAICGPSAPAAVYNLYITSTSPIWRGALAQYGNAGVFTPPPHHLPILLGIPLTATVISSWPAIRCLTRKGVRRSIAEAHAGVLLTATWVIVGFPLLYLPTGYQIKMLVAWQVPLALASTWVVCWAAGLLAHRLRPSDARGALLSAGLLVLAVLPTNAYLLGWRFVDLHRHTYPYYLASDEIGALDWLGSHSRPSDVVLSSLTIGEYVPEITGNNAFLAHWAMTLDYYAKRDAVDWYFNAAAPDAFRSQVIKQYGITYVYYGPAEKSLGTYDPATSPLLCEVHRQGDVTIYQTGCASAESGHASA